MSHFNEYKHPNFLRKSLYMLKSSPYHLKNKLGHNYKTDRIGQSACSTRNCRCKSQAISPKNVAPDLCTYHLSQSSNRARRVLITKISANYWGIRRCQRLKVRPEYIAMKSTRCEQGTYRSQLNFDNATKLLLLESAIYTATATAMPENRFAVSSMAAIIIPRPAILTLVTHQHPIKMLINLNGTIRLPGKFKTKIII